MSCLTVTIERNGGILVTTERVGGIDAGFERYGGIGVTMERKGGATATFESKGGIIVNMGLVCGASLGDYNILWVQDGPLLTIENGYLITE